MEVRGIARVEFGSRVPSPPRGLAGKAIAHRAALKEESVSDLP
jgi:hypothetical protein